MSLWGNGTKTATAPPPPLLVSCANDQAVIDGKGTNVPASVVYGRLMGMGFLRRPNKIVVRDAAIVGRLDLESAKIGMTVEFQRCLFQEKINLEQARAKGLYFENCTLHGIAAGQLQTTFSFVLRDCADTGGITLVGAHVRGQVVIIGTKLRPATGRALAADGLVVDQDMVCVDGFQAKGCVRLVGAHIGGEFRCRNAEFSCPGKTAIQASGLEVSEHVWWAEGCHIEGAIDLRGAHIEGDLHCEGGRFDNDGGIALKFGGLRVDQNVAFTSGADVVGGIDLTGCHVGGMLDLTGGRVRHTATIPALDLARAVVDQNMVCHNGCDITGKVLLAGARISGNLWWEGARFHNVNDVVVDATGMSVGRDAKLSSEPGNGGFVADGQVILSDAQIGGSLDCTGGEFDNDGKIAIAAQGLTVTRDVTFERGFVARGGVDLADAVIGGDLKCGGVFQYDGVALALRGASVSGRFEVRFDPEPKGEIDLSQATVGRLDDEDAAWPARLRLDGFKYGGIPVEGTVRDRLLWLERNPRFVPQIYLQLASVYHEAGSDGDSTTVSIAREDARRRSQRGLLGWCKQIVGLALKYTVQYGYRPLWVLWWVAALEIAGSVVFWQFHDHGIIQPVDKAHPDFNAILYTLDLLVPVINLGQTQYWFPLGAAVWVAAAYTIMGWILATCLVVGIGRIFNASQSGSSSQ